MTISSPVRGGDVQSLIQSLNDPSPMKRSESEMELAHLGRSARPALIDASRWNDPAISSAATRVLLSLPWSRPDDPPEIQALLTNYGSEDEQGRIRIAAAIFEKGPAVGTPVLLRLVVEDPSEDVCWEIEMLLRYRRDAKSLDEIRQLNPTTARPAALLLSGWAWLAKDHQKALSLLSQAVESENKHPSFDSGELDLAFTLLTQNAIAAAQYDRAAQLRRLQADRVSLSENSDPAAIYLLFFLHAKHGPLDGFAKDVRRYGRYLGDAPVLYAISQKYAREGRMVESLAYAQAAGAASLTCASRMTAAAFLAEAGWNDLARHEAIDCLTSNDPQTAVDRLRARLALAEWAGLDENDAAAVEHLSAAMDLIHQMPTDGLRLQQYGRSVEINNVASELAWRSGRIAMSHHDQATAKKQMDKLMELSPADPDIVQNAYALLKSAGRNEDAEKLFNDSYAQAHQELLQNPDDPVLMNQIAWLCGRCGEKLPEALEMSQKAAATEPDSAAILDTSAEVNFRMGHTDEAVRLETRALQLEPDDAFMAKQLARFRKNAP